MKRSVTLGLAAAAVLAVLLAFTGVAAAEDIDFSSGDKTVSIGTINIADGKQLKVTINFTNLGLVRDGEKTDINVAGLRDVLNGLKMDSFKVKMSSSGIDAENSVVTIAASLANLDYSVAELSKGLTFTQDTKVLNWIKVLDFMGEVSSFKINMLPTSSTASISMDITADIAKGKTVSPQIRIVSRHVDRFTTNPTASLNITSNDTVSKSYTLKVPNAVVVQPTQTTTPTPTATPTVTPTDVPTAAPTSNPAVSTPYVFPTSSATPFPATPAPFFGVLAALCCIGGIAVLRRK